MSGVVDTVMDLIFRPGSSLRLVPLINVAIVGLIGLMIALTYTTINPIHIAVMTFLALGLLASVNWFYYEFQRISAANGIEGAPAGTVATAGGDVKKTN